MLKEMKVWQCPPTRRKRWQSRLYRKNNVVSSSSSIKDINKEEIYKFNGNVSGLLQPPPSNISEDDNSQRGVLGKLPLHNNLDSGCMGGKRLPHKHNVIVGGVRGASPPLHQLLLLFLWGAICRM